MYHEIKVDGDALVAMGGVMGVIGAITDTAEFHPDTDQAGVQVGNKRKFGGPSAYLCRPEN